MPHFESHATQMMFYALAVIAALFLLYVGYRTGHLMGINSASRLIANKEAELFTAQRGFKNIYDKELAEVKQENLLLTQQVEAMKGRVEEYRKKAAGLGGLFSSGGKRADAMYALLLENEALEEALYAQNEKLRDERTDSLKEQLRATGYRRVLMSQLMNDERIKHYVNEVLSDEKALPGSGHSESPSSPLRHGDTEG